MYSTDSYFNVFDIDYGGSGTICGLGELGCLQKISRDLLLISQGNNNSYKELLDHGINCECPAGKMGFFNVSVQALRLG